LAAARAKLADLDALMARAQSDLAGTADAGSAQWGPDLLAFPAAVLAEAQGEADRFANLPRRLAPAEARDRVASLCAAVDRAHDRVTYAQAKIADYAAEIERKRSQLTQAIERAEALATEQPEFQPEWDALRARIALLRDRCRQASSVDQALDALAQAAQRTEAFAASARAQA
jgi:DNA repair ATPase RecN